MDLLEVSHGEAVLGHVAQAEAQAYLPLLLL